MENAFELVSAPQAIEIPPMRFAHAKVRGAYQPWTRVQTLDAVAEALERVGIERAGPAFGVYLDLPFTTRDPGEWVALLGYPVADEARVPPAPALRVLDLPAAHGIGLRYRGDLTSFPAALQFLLEWALRKRIEARGPLMERFYVSNALTGEEERDVYVTLDALALPG